MSGFDPVPVEVGDLAILFRNSGWSWDYWGKFYGPHGEKSRDIQIVLRAIRRSWECPRCDCASGCSCCDAFDCHDGGNPYVDREPCTTAPVDPFGVDDA